MKGRRKEDGWEVDGGLEEDGWVFEEALVGEDGV